MLIWGGCDHSDPYFLLCSATMRPYAAVSMSVLSFLSEMNAFWGMCFSCPSCLVGFLFPSVSLYLFSLTEAYNECTSNTGLKKNKQTTEHCSSHEEYQSSKKALWKWEEMQKDKSNHFCFSISWEERAASKYPNKRMTGRSSSVRVTLEK